MTRNQTFFPTLFVLDKTARREILIMMSSIDSTDTCKASFFVDVSALYTNVSTCDMASSIASTSCVNDAPVSVSVPPNMNTYTVSLSPLYSLVVYL